MDKHSSVLIAGATGMVGQALVAHLLNKNFRVKVLTRSIKKAYALFGDTVDILKWPSVNGSMLLPNSKNCDAFINLAGENIGEYRWTKTNKLRLEQSRVNSVNELCDLVKYMQFPPKIWIQASAIGYYGTNVNDTTTENGARGDGFLALLVQRWEGAFEKTQLPQTRKITLRLGLVMSHKGGLLKQMKNSLKLGVAICPGNGKNYLSYIYIDDLVRVIEFNLSNDSISGVVNAVVPKSIFMGAFVSKLKEQSKALMKINLPAFLLRLVLGKEKANELALANQNIYPKKLIDNGFEYHYPELSDFL